MKIGIIGSSGFIGSNLSSFLRKNTNYQIFSFSSYKRNKKNWINKVVNEINKKKPNIIVNCSANQNHLGKVEKKYIPNVLNSNLLSNILLTKLYNIKILRVLLPLEVKWNWVIKEIINQ